MINFLKRKIRATNTVINYSMFLSPWDFNKNHPIIGQGFTWKYVEKMDGVNVGLIKLLRNNECYGLIDSYCYIKPITDNRFLFWIRGTRKIDLYNAQLLKPIDSKEFNIKRGNLKYLFNCEPTDSIEYHPDLYQIELDFDFPESFKQIDEILQVNDLDGMYKDYKPGMHNTAIVSLRPKINQISIYPQDWFNRDEKIDFGYQWITRAERNIKTNKIHIQGIRLDDQILDETNRNIE